MTSINPSVVVQSALALTTAMLVTDAVRDGISAYGISPQHTLELKIIVAIVTLLITLFIIWQPLTHDPTESLDTFSSHAPSAGLRSESF